MRFADAVFNISTLVFLMLQIVFNVFSMVFAKTSLLSCRFCIRLFVTNYVCVVPYAGVMRNIDAIIRVSNYVCLNLGLPRARPLWSGASDKLTMPILPAERKFIGHILCYSPDSQWQRLRGNCLPTFRTTYLAKLGF